MRKLQGEAWLSSRQKRLEDIALTAGILPFAGAAGIAGAMAVTVIDRVNPLFKQHRVGQCDQPFEMYKIRTMPKHKDAVPSRGDHNDERASRVGKVLRKLRADETPQIWNVWGGTMSVIGPRALVEADYAHAREVVDEPTYTEWRQARGLARPGIFDQFGLQYHKGALGQDHETLIKERVEIDMGYIEGASHAHDLSILMETFGLFGKMAVAGSQFHE